LVAGLPDILIDGGKTGGTSLAFKKEIAEQLYTSDYKLAELLYSQYDNKNLINLLFKQGKEFFALGNYTEEYWEEQLKEPENIAGYLKQFIINYKTGNSGKSDLSLENELQGRYYEYALHVKDNFLQQWLIFDRNMKNILTAVNCYNYGYVVDQQLIRAGKENEVYNTLIKSSPRAEMLTDEVPYIDKILQVADSNMEFSEKEKALDIIKWEFLDEITFFNYFTIEKILSYIIKLEIVDRWRKLDDEKGKEFFNKLINEIELSYDFHEEYSLAGNSNI